MTELEILLLKTSYERFLKSNPEMELMELREKMTDLKVNIIKQEVDRLEQRIDREVDRLEHRIEWEVSRHEKHEEEPRCACCGGPLHTPYDPFWIFLCFVTAIGIPALMILTIMRHGV